MYWFWKLHIIISSCWHRLNCSLNFSKVKFLSKYLKFEQKYYNVRLLSQCLRGVFKKRWLQIPRATYARFKYVFVVFLLCLPIYCFGNKMDHRIYIKFCVKNRMNCSTHLKFVTTTGILISSCFNCTIFNIFNRMNQLKFRMSIKQCFWWEKYFHPKGLWWLCNMKIRDHFAAIYLIKIIINHYSEL